MAKCERYFIFLARVTGTVVLQAAVVFASRDTAYFVLSLFAAESKGDVLAGGDGVSLLSLIVGILAELIEVVAVVNRSTASGKHGAAGAADSYRFRRKNTVGDSDLFGTPADKAAAVVRISSEETSDKGAAFQRDIAAVLALDTDKAAVCAVAFYAAVSDSALDIEVFDGDGNVRIILRTAGRLGDADKAERGDIFVAAAAVVVERQRMSLSVKNTAEVVLTISRRAADGDVILEIDGLAREAVIRIVITQPAAEGVPIVGVFDPVLALQRNSVHRVITFDNTGMLLIII